MIGFLYCLFCSFKQGFHLRGVQFICLGLVNQMLQRGHQHITTLALHRPFYPAFDLANKAPDLGVLPRLQGCFRLVYQLLDILCDHSEAFEMVDFGFHFLDEFLYLLMFLQFL